MTKLKTIKDNFILFSSGEVGIDFNIKEDFGLDDEYKFWTFDVKFDYFMDALREYLLDNGFKFIGSDSELWNTLSEMGIIDKLDDSDKFEKFLINYFKEDAKKDYLEFKEYEDIEEEDYEDINKD